MSQDLLSSAEVAVLLGVSPSSVKRWADSGALECVRTPGRHRRFARAAVARFAADQRAPSAVGSETGATAGLAAEPEDVEAWLETLVAGQSVLELDARIAAERARLGAWWRVAEVFSDVLRCIGDRWQSGRLDLLAEHVASERLARALARAGDHLPPRPGAPCALLALADGEEHELGLRLVELVLREAGWPVRWAGARTPSDSVVQALASGGVDAVVLSASSARTDVAALAAQAERLARACAAAGVRLLVGGSAPWPPLPAPAERVPDLAALARLAASARGSGRRLAGAAERGARRDAESFEHPLEDELMEGP